MISFLICFVYVGFSEQYSFDEAEIYGHGFHINYSVSVSTNKAWLTLAKSTRFFFNTTAGISGGNTHVTIANTKNTKEKLIHQNWYIYFAIDDGSEEFRLNSTFIMHHDKYYPGYTSFESFNIPGYYIRHNSNGLKLETPGPGDFKTAASFMVNIMAQCSLHYIDGGDFRVEKRLVTAGDEIKVYCSTWSKLNLPENEYSVVCDENGNWQPHWPICEEHWGSRFSIKLTNVEIGKTFTVEVSYNIIASNNINNIFTIDINTNSLQKHKQFFIKYLQYVYSAKNMKMMQDETTKHNITFEDTARKIYGYNIIYKVADYGEKGNSDFLLTSVHENEESIYVSARRINVLQPANLNCKINDPETTMTTSENNLTIGLTIQNEDRCNQDIKGLKLQLFNENSMIYESLNNSKNCLEITYIKISKNFVEIYFETVFIDTKICLMITYSVVQQMNKSIVIPATIHFDLLYIKLKNSIKTLGRYKKVFKTKIHYTSPENCSGTVGKSPVISIVFQNQGEMFCYFIEEKFRSKCYNFGVTRKAFKYFSSKFSALNACTNSSCVGKDFFGNQLLYVNRKHSINNKYVEYSSRVGYSSSFIVKRNNSDYVQQINANKVGYFGLFDSSNQHEHFVWPVEKNCINTVGNSKETALSSCNIIKQYCYCAKDSYYWIKDGSLESTYSYCHMPSQESNQAVALTLDGQ